MSATIALVYVEAGNPYKGFDVSCEPPAIEPVVEKLEPSGEELAWEQARRAMPSRERLEAFVAQNRPRPAWLD